MPIPLTLSKIEVFSEGNYTRGTAKIIFPNVSFISTSNVVILSSEKCIVKWASCHLESRWVCLGKQEEGSFLRCGNLAQ